MNFVIKFCLHFFILILSAIAIILYCPGFFEIHKTPEKLTTSQQCPLILTGIETSEDMVNYNGVLLVSSRNLFGLLKQKQDEIQNGAIYGYYPRIKSQQQSNQLEKIKLRNFPKDKKFFPYGLKLFQNKLYILNQSMRKKEGELIEVFSIIETEENKIELQHIKTIKLPDYLVKKVNNLAILSENELFVSQYQPTDYPLLNFFVQLFNLKACGIYFCKINDESSQCFKQHDINSITAFNNGLWLQELQNQMKRLFVSHSLDKQIGVFAIRQNAEPEKKISFQYAVDIDGYPDNIIYDQERESFYIGSIQKPYEMALVMSKIDENGRLKDEVLAWSQVSIIKNSFYVNGLEAEKVVQLNDLIRMISVAVRIDDKLYLGSPIDHRILVCNMNELFE